MLWNEFVFGPIRSRRYGNSLGINLLPTQARVCNFQCPYCECHGRAAGGIAWPTVGEIEQGFAKALGSAAHIDNITLAGNGEPTLHPAFPAVMESLARLRGELRPGVPIVLLTNGTLLYKNDIRDSVIHYANESVVKADAMNLEMSAAINGVENPEIFERSLRAPFLLKEAGGAVCTQTLFCESRGRRNDEEPHVERWLDFLALLRPLKAYLYTVAREPAEPVTPVSVGRLRELAARVEALGIPPVLA